MIWKGCFALEMDTDMFGSNHCTANHSQLAFPEILCIPTITTLSHAFQNIEKN